VYKPLGLTRYGQRKQQERRDEPRRSPQAVGIKVVSWRNKETIGNSLSRGRRISLAAGAGAFVVVVYISMYLTGHGFHHGQ
jgi:hypothetical protein